MRRIEHPGPIAAQRRLTMDCVLTNANVTLAPGSTLLEALTDAVAAQGALSAVATLRGGSFDPFVFVMPALSSTPDHAVYFSDRHEPQGTVQLETANVTVGRRDGQPWLHCHGTWCDQTGQRLGGHVLPNEAQIAAPIEASIWFLHGASFEVRPSPETAFTLFEPVKSDARPALPSNAFAMAIRANEDLCTSLEVECGARGISSARVRGGVGSLVGASFDDGREVEAFVTEVFVKDGRVQLDAHGGLMAEVEVCVVDYLGGLNEGRLQRGANPVLVTFELVVEPLTFTQPLAHQ